MAIQIQPATSEFEDGVTQLFLGCDVPIDAPYWDRAFSPDAPSGLASRPWVAVDGDSGLVMAYAAARPVTLYLEGGMVSSQVLHDFVVASGALESEAAPALLKHVVSQADLTLSAGAGLQPTKILEREHFLCAGHFARLVFEPDAKSTAARDMTLPFVLEHIAEFPPAIEAINEMMIGERRIFRLRTPPERNWLFRGPAPPAEILAARENGPLDAYAVLRRVPGRAGEELHLVDAGCPLTQIKRMGLALAQLATARHLPLYVGIFGEAWALQLEESGFRRLRPRWPLHWMLKDPRQRALGNSLVRTDSWFFTPADGEIDH